MKRKEQEFYARAMPELPRILLGCERGNVRYARLGLIKWLKYSPRKALRGKLPVRYQGLTLRFTWSQDLSAGNHEDRATLSSCSNARVYKDMTTDVRAVAHQEFCGKENKMLSFGFP